MRAATHVFMVVTRTIAGQRLAAQKGQTEDVMGAMNAQEQSLEEEEEEDD